jgi:hypothetical protein
MGNPFGKSGYSVSKDTMKGLDNTLINQAGKGYSPGSSGYNVNPFSGGSYGVNQDTGRSFTTLPKFSDYVKEGNIDDAFAGISNAQSDATKRGLAGSNRSLMSSFGRGGLGIGGIGGARAANNAAYSRDLAGIQRQTGMDKLGYGTDMYKYERGQNLADELGLRGARATDNSGQRSDYLANLQGLTSQFGMDQSANMDAYNRALQTRNSLAGNATQGSKGWVAPVAKFVGDSAIKIASGGMA